jgi:hypothetical protein
MREVVAVSPLTDGDASSLHCIPMTEEAFEHLIGLESPYRLDQLDLELPLASVFEGVF